jgi:hypothetical protein
LLSSGPPEGDLEELSVGQRNQELLRLRHATIGPALEGVVTCPACGTRLELELDIPSLLAAAASAQEPRPVTHGDYTVSYRLLTSADLIEVRACSSVSQARLMLLERCVVGAEISPSDLPESLVSAVGEALSAADPLVDLPIHTVCADCGHDWWPWLDVGALVWSDVETLAAQALDDVAALARAYGWSEAEILGMTAARRRAYLERVNA